MLEITDQLSIDDNEIEFQAAPGGGPGGQNVNRVATKVTLSFDVANSPSLDEAQRALLLERLAGRLTKDGVLRVTSARHRTQGHNRRAASERLVAILQGAFEVPKERRATRPSRAAKRRRIESKKRRSQIKKGRRRKWTADD